MKHGRRKAAKLIAAVLIMTFMTAMPAGCGKGKNSTKNRDEVSVTPTVTDVPTDEPTKEPTAAPTAEPTPAPTEEPTVTPTEEPSEPIEYGNLTEYLDNPASEVISMINRDYRFEYWGKDHADIYSGGVITFDGIVYFGVSYGEQFDSSNYVSTIIIDNKAPEARGLNIGRGMKAGMTYAELKKIMGDDLSVPVAYHDGAEYEASGYYIEARYGFLWKQSPALAEKQADVVMIGDYFNREYMPKESITDYIEANKTLLEEHKAQYLAELRSQWKYAPVQKSAYLTTVQLDGHNKAEIYEAASFGHAPTYGVKKDEDDRVVDLSFTGVDDKAELYNYYLVLNLISDGQYVKSEYYSNGSYNTWPPEVGTYSEDSMYCGIVRGAEYNAEAEALRSIIGIPGEQKDSVIYTVNCRRPVSEPDVYWSANISAQYLNDSKTPFAVTTYLSYESNDGGTEDEEWYNADGKPLFEGAKMLREGTGELYGRKFYWALNETSSGLQYVSIEIIREESALYRKYLIVDGCLVLFDSEVVV
ncbi:MAG: PT domain-containing protein [Lachnospiraceae bacterium]|nr:PT domain-containing protein [Lachnospiraceae bacterium]